jgi:acetylornithine deacetylase/succinyl-diaminopimelate desuccinylase-like protein
MERDGFLYGLGACDVKGGLAAQVLAACALAGTPGWSGELVVQAVADEEDGSRLGAEHLLALGLLTADGAIVAEPTGCAPSLVQLGNAWAEITIGGRAAHAGTPERGQDAFRGSLR